MECPHLANCLILKGLPHHVKNAFPFVCSTCDTEKSPWMCISCGAINCGRYVNAHAKDHFEKNLEHCVCIDCYSFACYCYLCDEFAVNDTNSGAVDKLRDKLKTLHPDETEKNEEKKLRRSRRLSKTDSPAFKKLKQGNKQIRAAGLRNLGNTCFMNAVLQSLSNIDQFCGYIKQLPCLEDRAKKYKSLRPRDNMRATRAYNEDTN